MCTRSARGKAKRKADELRVLHFVVGIAGSGGDPGDLHRGERRLRLPQRVELPLEHDHGLVPLEDLPPQTI